MDECILQACLNACMIVFCLHIEIVSNLKMSAVVVGSMNEPKIQYMVLGFEYVLGAQPAQTTTC